MKLQRSVEYLPRSQMVWKSDYKIAAVRKKRLLNKSPGNLPRGQMVWKNDNKIAPVRKQRLPDKSPENLINSLTKADKLADSYEAISNYSEID